MLPYQLKARDLWFRTVPGALVVDCELKALSHLLPAIPGQVALQIGGPSDLQLLQKSKMRHVYYCGDQTSWRGDGRHIQCEYPSLPFGSDTIHLIVLTHVLEFVEQPKQLLEEVYRILAPGGQLIVLGFNRWNPWSFFQRHGKQKGYPWLGTFYSIWQVKQWLDQLDYGLISNKSFCFTPLMNQRLPRWLLNLSEVLGQVFIPKMGAVHLIYAQKKVAGATPLATLWSNHRQAVQKVVYQ